MYWNGIWRIRCINLDVVVFPLSPWWWVDWTINGWRQVNIIAHNFQGSDGYFVVRQYHTDNQIVEQLRNGCKLLQVERDSIRFIDSLSVFQFLLLAFPKTFRLTELPHKFNIPENQEYVGPIPVNDYYMPEAMSPEGRQEFEKWHQEQRDNHKVFDFQKNWCSTANQMSTY